MWWFLNDDEPDPPDWQLPGKPFIIRQLSWYLRNPLHNFGKYVLGVVDRNYTVVGTAPVYATFWSDADPAKKGWKVSTIRIGGLRLPFVSYEDEYLIGYDKPSLPERTRLGPPGADVKSFRPRRDRAAHSSTRPSVSALSRR